MSQYIFLLYHIYHLCFTCIDFYDLSAWGGCWFDVYIRRFIYKFLKMCPFDYTAVAGSGKVGPVNQVNHTSLVAVVTPTDRYFMLVMMFREIFRTSAFVEYVTLLALYQPSWDAILLIPKLGSQHHFCFSFPWTNIYNSTHSLNHSSGIMLKYPYIFYTYTYNYCIPRAMST